MSVAGEAVEDPGQSSGDSGGDSGGGSEPAPAPEIEGDVPKPAFEEPEPAESAQQARAGLNGKDKRNQKAGGYAAEVARWRNEALQERTERQRMAERIARMEGEMQARRTDQQQGPDPVREQLRGVRAGIEQALARMGQGDPGAVTEWHELREREQRIISRAEAMEVARQSAPPRLDPILTAVVSRHDWLHSDPELRQIAEGYVSRLVRQERRDMSDPAVRKQTLLQAAAQVERDLDMNTTNAHEPTDTQRDRYRGLGGQTSGAGRTSNKAMVYLTADQKAQAESLFRHMEPEAAHREWWSKIGEGIRDKGR
jgi:hypothetical protein